MQQLGHLVALRQVGIGYIRHTVHLCPVSDRLEIYADHRRQFIQSGTKNCRILDVRAELQPVLDIVRHIAFPTGCVHDFRHTAQNHEMTIVLNVAGVTSMQPPVLEGFSSRFGFVEIAFEHTV